MSASDVQRRVRGVVGLDLLDRAGGLLAAEDDQRCESTDAAAMPPRALRIGGSVDQRRVRGLYASWVVKLPAPRCGPPERASARAATALARCSRAVGIAGPARPAPGPDVVDLELPGGRRRGRRRPPRTAGRRSPASCGRRARSARRAAVSTECAQRVVAVQGGRRPGQGRAPPCTRPPRTACRPRRRRRCGSSGWAATAREPTSCAARS